MTKLDLVRPVSTGIRCLAKLNSLERTILYKFGFYLYFCQKFWEKRGRTAKTLIIMWPAKTTSIYLQFLFPFVHFYCSRAHIEKDHLIFQNIFEGQKFPIKIQNKSSDNLRVPLHKPSACNDPKTPFSLALHLFNRDSTKNHQLSRSFRILPPTACPRGWAGLKSSSSTWKEISDMSNIFVKSQVSLLP